MFFKPTRLITIVFLSTVFLVNTVFSFQYKPEYAQKSHLAYSQSLGLTSLALPFQNSSIMEAPARMYDMLSSYTLGYGFSQYAGHTLEVSYLQDPTKTPYNLAIGFSYTNSIIPKGTSIFNKYIQGKTNTLGFEQVLTMATAYSFGDSGTFGINVKIPTHHYNKGNWGGGFLLGAGYNINFFGFNFMVGLANIGAMYVDNHMDGVYPDIQAALSYVHKNSEQESIFEIGVSLENNLGELFDDSFVFGMGGKIRIFSTGLLNKKPLIQDNVLESHDGRKKISDFSPSKFYSILFLNLGFQFSSDSHFSLGLTSQVNQFLIDLGVVFPSANTKKFGFYVSFGSLL